MPMSRTSASGVSAPLRLFWSVYACVYDAIWDAPLTDAIMQEVFRTVPGAISSVSLAVDLGCGTGLSARVLAACGYEVTGVDACEQMLARATGRHRIDRAVRADAAASGLPARSADLVCACNVLQLPARPEGVLEEADRLLRQNGLLVCAWPVSGLTLTRLFAADMRTGRGGVSSCVAAALRLAVGLVGAPMGARSHDGDEVRACVGAWALRRGYRVVDQGVAAGVSEYAVLRSLHDVPARDMGTSGREAV